MHRCPEAGCEEKFDDFDELTVHCSYHEYHQKIKSQGRKELDLLESRFSTTIQCPLAERLEGCYYFPQLPTKLICEWYECHQEFLSAELFYAHVANHAHRFVDKCYWANCNKVMKTTTKQLLREHLRVHSLQKLYACPYCGNFFSTKIKFDDHFLRHLPPPKFLEDRSRKPLCVRSTKEGDNNYDIEEYDVDGNRIKIFRCTNGDCDKAFLTPSLLGEHVRIHSNKNKCEQCSYVGKSSSKLRSHILYKHQTERSFECTICLKTFKQRGDLRAHVRRHQIVEPYRCDKCDFETLNEEGLTTHLKLHDKNHNYCCHICQKVFNRGNNLSRHLKELHKLSLPEGQSRFKYKLVGEGIYLLDTEDDSVILEASRRWKKFEEFCKKVEKLPGPPTCMPILGNIPTKVFSLLTNKSAPNYAGEFYTSQIQSVLGHTIIYRDEQIFRLWIGQEPVVCVWKPEIVELVLGDNFLLEKSYHYDFLRPWLGNGLLTSPGRIWRPRRKLLVPSFHFHILQAFVPVFDRKSRLMVRNLKRKLNEKLQNSYKNTAKSTTTTRGQQIFGSTMEQKDYNDDNSIVVDITPVVTACTLDAICETIMGVTIDAQENPNNDYCQSVYIVGETFLERIIQPQYWLDTLFRLTELGKLYKYHLNKLHSFTRKVIAEKKRERKGSIQDKTSSGNFKMRVMDKTSVDSFKEKMEMKKDKQTTPQLPKAFLDLLLEKLNTSTGEQKLTDEEIREEVDTFMFEGHDTTAMALSWTLFLLGHNLNVQKKLQQEIDHLFETQLFDTTGNEDDADQGDIIELDHVKKLKYLECVIKEALRLCPSVPFIGRQTTSELKLGNHLIPPGCVVFVLIYQLHRNGDIFPNPERFDPDRFLPENTIGRHPFAYVPFSAGPRNCIGQKFAMAEMKTILLNLIRNFEFESITPLDKARVQMEMVLRPKCSLNIRIKPRRH